jgi:hypothetical protein
MTLHSQDYWAGWHAAKGADAPHSHDYWDGFSTAVSRMVQSRLKGETSEVRVQLFPDEIAFTVDVEPRYAKYTQQVIKEIREIVLPRSRERDERSDAKLCGASYYGAAIPWHKGGVLHVRGQAVLPP